jgi:hypothetical protein
MNYVSAVLVLLVSGVFGCASRPFMVEGVREFKLSQVEVVKHTRADVQRIWGQPPFEDGDQWDFPVQSAPFGPHLGMPKLWPAIRLKVWLDQQGCVADWAFLHPTKEQRLFAKPDAGFIESPRIDLNRLLTRDRTKAEILAIFRYRFGSNLRKLCREESCDQGVVLVFYVDRPDQFFIPPSWIRVWFDPQDRVAGRHTWGYR